MGYYTNQLFDEIRSSYEREDLPFYMRPESRVSLRDGVTYLDLSNPIHEVNYYMLRAHKIIKAKLYKDIIDEQDSIINLHKIKYNALYKEVETLQNNLNNSNKCIR